MALQPLLPVVPTAPTAPSPRPPPTVPGPYAEHPPAAALRGLVECVWTRGAPPPVAAASHRILPDGCVDLLLVVRDAGAPGGRPAIESLDVVGAMTRPVVVAPRPGLAHVGVRLRPGAARALLGVPAAEVTDLRLPVAGLWPDAAAMLGDGDDWRCVVERLLGRPAPADLPPPAVRAAVRDIEASDGRLAVAALCERLGVTRQHLARLFALHVGLSPKLLSRVVRVRGALRRAEQDADPDWSRIALECGYCDQAHLVGDVGELTGLSPGRWLAERRAASVPFRQDAGIAAD